jgi:hypothetical protein
VIGEHKFHFVMGRQVRQIFPEIALRLARAGRFDVHNTRHARIDAADVERAAGFQ